MKRITLHEDEIKLVVNILEQKELKVASHLYKRYPGRPIGEASDIFSNKYSDEAKERPGLVLLAVILAAHRNYTKQVEPQINRIRRKNFYSFDDLNQKTRSFNDFSDFCGMRDLEKYTIITQLLDAIDKLKKYSDIADDYKVMEKWALLANYIKHKEDIIGRIKGIGIATFQHLRMNFGANTVKPDQRVKEVLKHEFNFYSDVDVDYISAVEYIAKVIGKSALYIDQVFVNYGSGYYIQGYNTEKVSVDTKSLASKQEKEKVIIQNSNKVGSSTEQMLEYINNIIRGLNVFIEKRGDGGHIAVANKLRHLTRGKNVFTYWPTTTSVAVIILGLLSRKTYYSVEEMQNDQVAEKIRCKYSEMVI